VSFLTSAPTAPAEDPATKRLREQQQTQAENERIRSIQTQLSGETVRSQSAQFGLRSLSGPLGSSAVARRWYIGSG
jgi:hypothetical protein